MQSTAKIIPFPAGPIRTAESLEYREARQRRFMRRASLTLWACAALTLLAMAASAQEQTCAPIEALSDSLAAEYGEMPFATGRARGTALIIMTNPETGTWTTIEAIPDGTACIRGAGDGFRAVKQGMAS